MTSLGFETHDHAHCIKGGLAAVEKACADKGLRLTPVRRRVLEILLGQHKPMGAYDILDQLKAEGLGSQPPVVYRALDFLVQNRFVHKIERLNAFVACGHPGERHKPAFLICRNCAAVAEADADLAQGMLGDLAREAGFAIERAVVEVEGLCPKCRVEA